MGLARALSASLILLSLGQGQAFAQTSRDVRELEGIETQLRIHQVIVEQLALSEDEPGAQLNDTTGPIRLESIVDQAMTEGFRKAALSEAERSTLKRFIHRLNWKKLWNHVSSVPTQLRTSARLHGPSIAIWTGVGFGFELLTAVAVVALGRPELYPIVTPFVPGPMYTTTGALAVEKLLARKRLIALYGGRENWDHLNEALDRARKTLKINGSQDLLIPLTTEDEQAFTISVRAQKLPQKILGWMGIGKPKVGLGEIRSFIADQGWETPLLRGLALLELSEEMRCVLLLGELARAHPTELAVRLRHAFPDSVAPIDKVLVSYELTGRVVEMKRAKSWEAVSESLQSWAKEVDGLDDRMVFEIWERIVLPGLAESLTGMGVGAFRQVVKAAEKSKARASVSAVRRSGQDAVLEIRRAVAEILEESPACEAGLLAQN